MTDPIRNRSLLLLGCCSAALALALAMAPQDAQAQGIQASGNVVFGSAEITDTGPAETTVDMFAPTTVIDWIPTQDNNGNALPFVPTGGTALFQARQFTDFAVLNRILPQPNGNIVVIDGAVLSRVLDATGNPAAGGFVAFYSPTGILIGNNATFDVGKLLLTTLNTTDTGFQNFAEFGGNLALTGAAGSTARIQILSGARIAASRDNAFFAVVAADIEMRGSARINGSHAYVAGEVVNLQYSNGLFNISIPVGTAAAGEVVTVNGNVGGPASTGTGDNHMIIGVARAGGDPISMLFSGNLGFDPAASAGIVNGEIILSANHNVFGRFVDGGSVSDGLNAEFGANSALTNVRADIFLQDFNVTSSLLASGTHLTRASAINTASSVAGNLLLVGRQTAELTANSNRVLTVSGDVLVSAQDYGVVSSGLPDISVINAQGGAARVLAQSGSTINIGGNALVTADAYAGADALNRIVGSARGGTAQIHANGGTINISGFTTVNANAVGAPINDLFSGADSRGGSAEILVDSGGDIRIDQNVEVNANAFGANGSLSGPSSVSNAYGGSAEFNLSNTGSSLTIGGQATARASARGGSSNNSGAGSIGDAGLAIANISGAGLIRVNGGMTLESAGFGGVNSGGIGGIGLGGRASAAVFSGAGTIEIGQDFNAQASGNGGSGVTGGDGTGGITGAIAETGTVTIGGSAQVGAIGFGGGAFFDFGGNGGLGRAGTSFLQATGNLTQTASLSVAGNASIFADGVGGAGGAGNGDNIAAGRGGDGIGGQFTVPNQADSTFPNGAYILAGGDNGRISITGTALAAANGFGGRGGTGPGTQPGGRGGDGLGGLAQIGLALLGSNGSLGQGLASFANIRADASGVGGEGGLTGDFTTASGGNGTGGGAFMTVRAGDITAAQVELTANGFGSVGTVGGFGRGGQSGLFGSLGGTATLSQLTLSSGGFGGFTFFGTGGDALGGLAAVESDGITITVNGDIFIKALGSGGGSEDGAGGNATGGTAYVATLTGNNRGAITITGHAQVLANANGGNTITNFAAGNGTGGIAYIEANGGSAVTIGSAQVHAVGDGGTAQLHQGGNGTGGSARITATGTNSRVTIQNPIPAAFNNNTPGGFAVINANGLGQATRGGNGIGGTGRGGTAEVTAIAGGSVALQANTSASFNNAVFARGFGGDSFVEGGVGGDAIGGALTLLADGGSINMGAATPSTFSQAGASVDATRNISGGNASGGSRTIRVINGGSLTMQGNGGGAGAQGGNGSGTGNGGNAIAGDVVFEVINSTVNLIGSSPLFNNANGGNGQVGGNVSGGTITFNALDSIINLLPNAAGVASLAINNEVLGGNGVTAGGSAQGSLVLVTVDGTQINGGTFGTRLTATGGNASAANGVGGNAIGATLAANFIDTTLNFTGEVLLAADATGGNGGVTGVGGNATTGDVELVFTRANIAFAADAQGAPGILRVRAQAKGGQGATIGNGTSRRALIDLVDSNLTVASVYVESRAFADATGAGEIGGTAISQQARLGLFGVSAITANLIEINASVVTSQGGSSRGGNASLLAESGSTSTVTAQRVNLLADALNGITNAAGSFSVNVAGGNTNLGSLTASALGNALNTELPVSSLIATGGSLAVTGSLSASTYGDISILTNAGNFIGSLPTAGTTAAIQLQAGGTIQTGSDGSSVGGLGGQTITMQAGRSILLGGNLSTRDGAVSLTANNGGGATLVSPQPSIISMSPGTRISAGTGTITIRLLDGEGDPQRANGAITLASVSGGKIDVRNLGSSAGSDISVISGGVLTASGTGRAIDLASLNGEVINLAGDAGLVLTGGGHYAVFAATPTGSQIGSFSNYSRRYNVSNAAAYDALNPGGNFAAFRIAPVLTVAADNATRFYGSVNPQFTSSFAGFLPGDGPAGITGAAALSTSATANSNVGTFAINSALGTLVSDQGYQFAFNSGQLTITPRLLTVTANNLSRVYGNANPALTFTVGGQGLVNGDQLAGALATTATATTGVGTVAINQGTLAATSNYILTFVDGQLSITPRLLTVTADNLSKFLRQQDPVLTYTLTGDVLVNGDLLSGLLLRDAGEGLGTYAIRQGSLTAGPNYTITFVGGTFEINPPPTPPVLTSPALIEAPFLASEEPPMTSEEEEERFGMDFPERPDAPLITQESLLDDPVSSGGDASLYSGDANAAPGGGEKK